MGVGWGRGWGPTPKKLFFQFSFFCNVRSKNRVLGPPKFLGVGAPLSREIPPPNFFHFIGSRLGGLTTVPNLVRLGVTLWALRAPKLLNFAPISLFSGEFGAIWGMHCWCHDRSLSTFHQDLPMRTNAENFWSLVVA